MGFGDAMGRFDEWKGEEDGERGRKRRGGYLPVFGMVAEDGG